MRNYELVVIFDPSLSQEQQKSQLKKIEDLLGKKGKVKETDTWGKKTFAYPIEKQKEGIYVLLKVGLDEKSIPDFEKKLKLEEKILRYLLIKV